MKVKGKADRHAMPCHAMLACDLTVCPLFRFHLTIMYKPSKFYIIIRRREDVNVTIHYKSTTEAIRTPHNAYIHRFLFMGKYMSNHYIIIIIVPSCERVEQQHGWVKINKSVAGCGILTTNYFSTKLVLTQKPCRV